MNLGTPQEMIDDERLQNKAEEPKLSGCGIILIIIVIILISIIFYKSILILKP